MTKPTFPEPSLHAESCGHHGKMNLSKILSAEERHSNPHVRDPKGSEKNCFQFLHSSFFYPWFHWDLNPGTIVHLLAIVCFYQAELSESGNEWADRAGKKRLFAAMQPYIIIQF